MINLKEKYPKPTENVFRGDCGDNVKWVQDNLNKCGYNLAVDGIFGDKTLAAVKEFQTAYYLDVDGIVGVKTRAVLGA